MHKSVTIQKHSSKLRSAAAKGRPGPGFLVAAAAWLLNRIRRLYLELVQLSRYDHIFSWEKGPAI